jgi:thiol-disulfide isomerase/thioredoxin
MHPIFEKISEKLSSDELSFSEIDVDDDTEDLSSKYGIRNIPAILVIDEDDKVLGRFVGAMSEESLEEKIKDALK